MLDAAEAAHARGARVAAVGCLVERYRDELAAELPEVDLWCGLRRGARCVRRSTRARRGDEARGPQGAVASGRRSTVAPAMPSPRRTRPVHAYVKISDGCDRRCAFCAIPLIKGRYEARAARRRPATPRGAALARGARELVLVGQDTSRWSWPG